MLIMTIGLVFPSTVSLVASTTGIGEQHQSRVYVPSIRFAYTDANAQRVGGRGDVAGRGGNGAGGRGDGAGRGVDGRGDGAGSKGAIDRQEPSSSVEKVDTSKPASRAVRDRVNDMVNSEGGRELSKEEEAAVIESGWK